MYDRAASDEFYEHHPTTENLHAVQYFESARFEYHPEHAGTPHEVQLGLLGRQVLQARGWLPAAQL